MARTTSTEPPRATRSSRSTPRRSPCRARSTSATSSASPTPTRSPASTACAASRSSTRWVGTTTACPPSGGCRTSSASAATPPCRSTRTSDRRRRPGRTRCRSAGATSSSCASGSPRWTSRPSRTCGAGSGSPSTGGTTTRPSTSAPAAPARWRSCATWPGARPTSRRPRPSGTWTTARPSPRPRWRTGRRRARTTSSPSTGRDGSGDIVIDTTRPELVASCVALVAHPGDARHQPLFGTTATTPLFGVEIPVVAHELADPEKGTGIAMICTFGDVTDVTWWRELQLPTRAVVGRDGRLAAAVPDWITTDAGRAAYGELAGRTVKQAQARIVELLRESGELLGEPRPLTHPVKFYERGSRPLEIVTSRQWYIRNGGRDEALRERFLERGRELRWYPPFMRHRYDNWVGGLNGDWLISRQRFFGVPFPLWYPLGADGEVDHDHPIVPDESALPLDPSSDVPARVHRGAAGPARRLRRRPGRHGHLGHLVADPADRRRLDRRSGPLRPGVPDGPPTPGPRHHPDLAVRRHRPLRLRARHAAVDERGDQRVDPRPRPQEDVEVEGQRRDADGPPRAARRRRRPLLGGIRPAGRRHRVRRGADAHRPQARHQAAQRQQVRARLRGARRRARRSSSRWTGPCSPAWPA